MKLIITILILTLSFHPCQAAIEFDGVDDYISINNSNELDFTSSYTLSAWINPDLIDNYNMVFWRGAGAASEIEFYGRAADTVLLHNRAGSGGTLTYKTGPALSTGWQHVAIVYNGNTASWKVYYDAAEQAFSLTTGNGENPVDNNSEWKIGAGGSGFPSSEFNGKMDDARIYNRAISTSEIEALYNSRSKRPSGSLANGLVAHYEMDDKEIGHVAAQAQDDSGNLNHGEFVGFDNLVSNGFSNDVPANIGNRTSLEFDGVNDYIEISNFGLIPNDFSVSMWINANDYSASPAGHNQRLFYWYDGVRRWQAILSETGNFVFGSESGSDNIGIGSTTRPNLGQWVHITTVRNGGNLNFYYDAVDQSTSSVVPGAPVGTVNAFKIGADSFGAAANGFFNGSISDVRAYNKALSPSEISFIYNGSGLNPGTSNLQALWAFDDSALKDSSGNDNHGVGVGGDSLKYTEGVLRR